MNLPPPLPQLLQAYPRLRAKQAHEYHVVLQEKEALRQVAEALRDHHWRLITMFVNDERMEEDCRFKIYYLFASPLPAHAKNQNQMSSFTDQGYLLTLEYFLTRHARPDPPSSFPLLLRFHPSLRECFPAVQPFEEAIVDFFALLPDAGDPVQVQRMLAEPHWLHRSFSQTTAPLRRTRTLERVEEERVQPPLKHLYPPDPPPEGMHYLPVGPIHAGVIEPGRFLFLHGGEPIEAMPIHLGYKHKGLEKLFETHYLLAEGWQLAERVSGDAAFSHALAYCQAVESLAGMEPPRPAQLWRAILLELERIANHIHNISDLLHDISLHIAASQIALQWESLLQMFHALFGDRYLRNLVRPGGLMLPEASWKSRRRTNSLQTLQRTLEEVISLFLSLGQRDAWDVSLHDRAVGTGVLNREEAKRWGAVGFVARASGLIHDDVRIRYPQGVYQQEAIQRILAQTFAADLTDNNAPQRFIALSSEDMQGDVYARFLLRLAEVESSFYLIDTFLQQLMETSWTPVLRDTAWREKLDATPTFDASLGYVESWRGGVYYWVMKGPMNTIARCKVTGPSIINWFVFPKAVSRHTKTPETVNILADFPLINKSFNLSYAERDL